MTQLRNTRPWQSKGSSGAAIPATGLFLSLLMIFVGDGAAFLSQQIPLSRHHYRHHEIEKPGFLLATSKPLQHKHRPSDRYSSTTVSESKVANQLSDLYASGEKGHHHLAYKKNIRRVQKAQEQQSSQQQQQQQEKSTTTTTATIPPNELLNQLNRYPSLILNADYQPMSYLPLSVCHWQEAIKLIFSGKVAVVDVYEGVTIRAANIEIPLPSVVALNDYVPQCSHKPAFTRRNVFLRDEYVCQYCGNRFHTKDLSIDHVVPRSMGGKLTWDNAVTSCLKCNGKKGNTHPSDLKSIGMKLLNKPRAPTRHELAMKAGKMLPRRVHPTWQPYLSIVFDKDDDGFDDDDMNRATPDLEALGITREEAGLVGGDAEEQKNSANKKMSKNKKKRLSKKKKQQTKQLQSQ